MLHPAKRIAAGAAAITMIVALFACQKEGPAERAGKEVDQAVEKAKDVVRK